MLTSTLAHACLPKVEQISAVYVLTVGPACRPSASVSHNRLYKYE